MLCLSFVPASVSLSVRLAERRDILPLARLVQESFAAGRYGEVTYASVRRTPLEALVTTLRVGLDIERRLTPWDWCRHAQVVAESGEGRDRRIVGFVEVWGEDRSSLHNVSALSPQPMIFNLCVAAAARRRGVARALLDRCEEQCRVVWGEDALFLKVRDDNDAACQLYAEMGWELIETRATQPLAAWQEQWKGGARPMKVMRKPHAGHGSTRVAPPHVSRPLRPHRAPSIRCVHRLPLPLADARGSPPAAGGGSSVGDPSAGGGREPLPGVPRAKRFDEFEVTLEQVLAVVTFWPTS